MLDQKERYYRKTVSAIGWTMLLFFLIINAVGVILSFLPSFFFYLFPNSTVMPNVAYQIAYGAGYLLSFMLPVCLLRGIIRGAGYEYQSMRAPFRVTPWIFLLIPAVIAINYAAANLNAILVSVFDYAAFSSDVLWGESMIKPQNYEWVLQFIVTCVVPGFCEEFLFRGAIQANCRPFGRSNAILISSLLFAMMHQNAGQFFYTFVAGILLGLVYEITGSIWNCTILHIFNNFLSLNESVILYQFDDPLVANLAVSLFEMAILILGIISVAILVARFSKEKRTDLKDGIFGQELPMAGDYAVCPISSKRAFCLFFSPPMVIFLVLCILQMLLLIALAVFYGTIHG